MTCPCPGLFRPTATLRLWGHQGYSAMWRRRGGPGSAQPPSPCSPTAPVSSPQIDQDGLTLPERTLYLGQDEESEKVRGAQ